MTTMVRTPRLDLRYFEDTDGPAVLAYHADPEIARYLSPRPPMTLELARATAAAFARSRGEPSGASLALAIVRRDLSDTEELVGELTLTKVRLHAGFYMGFIVRRDVWGRGYASEAARAALSYAFKTLRVERVRAGALPDNVASLRVLRKIGMTPRGTRWLFPHAPLGAMSSTFEARRDVWLRWYGGPRTS